MKYLKIKSALLLIILFLAGNQLSAQKEINKLKSQIKTLNDKMIKAGLDEDTETMAAMYSDDIIYLPNYSPMVKGKKKVMEMDKESQKEGYKMTAWTLKTDEIFPDKKYIIETGTYSVTIKVPQMPEPVNDKGKYVTVWVRQKDGGLKIFIDTWNSDLNPMAMDNNMMEEKK